MRKGDIWVDLDERVTSSCISFVLQAEGEEASVQIQRSKSNSDSEKLKKLLETSIPSTFLESSDSVDLG